MPERITVQATNYAGGSAAATEEIACPTSLPTGPKRSYPPITPQPTPTAIPPLTVSCTPFVVFDPEKPPFDDDKFRRALAHALDKEKYRSIKFEADFGVPAYPLEGLSVLPHLEFDLERAQQLLAESKYPKKEERPVIRFTSPRFADSRDEYIAGLAAGPYFAVNEWAKIHWRELDLELNVLFGGVEEPQVFVVVECTEPQ